MACRAVEHVQPERRPLKIGKVGLKKLLVPDLTDDQRFSNLCSSVVKIELRDRGGEARPAAVPSLEQVEVCQSLVLQREVEGRVNLVHGEKMMVGIRASDVADDIGPSLGVEKGGKLVINRQEPRP